MGSHSDPPNVTPKADHHQKKVMRFGGIGREFSTMSSYYPRKQSIMMSTVKNFRNWRKKLKKTTRIGQPEGRRLSSRPHITLKTQEKLGELDWDILLHSPYSLGLTSSDYHLFISLEHYLRGEKFESEEHIKTSLLLFLQNLTWSSRTSYISAISQKSSAYRSKFVK